MDRPSVRAGQKPSACRDASEGFEDAGHGLRRFKPAKIDLERELVSGRWFLQVQDLIDLDGRVEQDLPITVGLFAGKVTEPMAREFFQEWGGLKRGDDPQLLSLLQGFNHLQDAGAGRSSLGEVLADIQRHYRFEHDMPTLQEVGVSVFDPDQAWFAFAAVNVQAAAREPVGGSQFPGFAPTIEGSGMDPELRSNPGQIVAARIQELPGGFKFLFSAQG
jgi:hypothetical protein